MARGGDEPPRSDLAHAAVDDELGAGDEAALPRRQEQRGGSDLLGLADAPDRDGLGDAPDALLTADEVGEARRTSSAPGSAR